MRDELYDHQEDYFSLTYEYWCDLLSKIEVKDEIKISVVHINNIDSAGASSLSDSDNSMSIPRRKKANTGVLRSKKSPRRSHDRHRGVQCYCVICKKSGMYEHNYIPHSAENYTGVRTKHPINDGMGGPMGSRTNDCGS